jgi:hypothetical protein
VLQDLNGHEPDINGYYYQDFYSLFDYSPYNFNMMTYGQVSADSSGNTSYSSWNPSTGETYQVTPGSVVGGTGSGYGGNGYGGGGTTSLELSYTGGGGRNILYNDLYNNLYADSGEIVCDACISGGTIEYDPSSSGKLNNPNTRQAVLDIGDKLNAERILVVGADRTREVHERLIKLSPKGEVAESYETTQHGSVQGYRAADVKYYNNGRQISPLTVAQTAQTIPAIGGIGVYRTFTHIDIRPRKSDGSIYKWGW